MIEKLVVVLVVVVVVVVVAAAAVAAAAAAVAVVVVVVVAAIITAGPYTLKSQLRALFCSGFLPPGKAATFPQNQGKCLSNHLASLKIWGFDIL